MANNKIIITKSSKETERIGYTIGYSVREAWKDSNISKSSIFCLYGNLGSGKTTFSQGFAHGLGITGRLLSPTFIILKRYSLSDVDRFFYHIDLYRIENPTDIYELGTQEIFSDIRSCVLIEWAERLDSFVPKNRTDIHFSVDAVGNHRLELSEIYT